MGRELPADVSAESVNAKHEPSQPRGRALFRLVDLMCRMGESSGLAKKCGTPPARSGQRCKKYQEGSQGGRLGKMERSCLT